ncbi:helix-turn-helix transcriptional regulator [Sphingomonas bacterium]|uniref:helix-turn-helix transcriptional regulator n=1 Tax=Sphingomonas bacterium TaxID=1895847 RepID=UPI001576376C|nr:helix-turn-helix transcriptional regulator [Sphingomonas bacterium]
MLGPLIEAVGTSQFPKLLFDSIQDDVECVHLSAFASEQGTRALILAENQSPARTAGDRDRRHLDTYWKPDRSLYRSRGLGDERPADLFLFEIMPSDLGRGDHCADCYATMRVGARLSVCETRGSRTLRLNVYSPTSFAPHELDYLRDHAALFMPLVWRHAKDCIKSAEPGDELEVRLRKVAPDLTQRENQVCALIALGVTSEGIAIRLAMRLNTVLTYRKRAYKRLRISSQNELFRLIWSPQPT